MHAVPHDPDSPPDNQEETLDLVDESNRVIGTVRRADVHGNPRLQHRAVHVFVKNRKGDIFLQKRGRSKLVAPGKWDTSVGGHLTAGQKYEEAALREMEEELGLSRLNPSALKHSHDYVWRSGVETEHVRTFIVESEGPFKLDTTEIDEGRFWSPGEMRAAIGTGALSDNLEAELEHLRIRGLD